MHEPIFEDIQAEEENESEVMAEPDPNPAQPQGKRPTSRPLKERSDNIRGSARKVAFTTQDSTEADEKDETMPVKAHKFGAVTRRPSRKKLPSKLPQSKPPGQVSAEIDLTDSTENAGEQNHPDDRRTEASSCRRRSTSSRAVKKRDRKPEKKSTR